MMLLWVLESVTSNVRCICRLHIWLAHESHVVINSCMLDGNCILV